MTGRPLSLVSLRPLWWCAIGLFAVLASTAPLSGDSPGIARPALADASDRDAARTWFVALADAQFYRTTPDVTDCAGLVRHALREAIRPHTPEWTRLAALPRAVALPELRQPQRVAGDHLPLFRLTRSLPPRYGEFADASTIVGLNARAVGRDARRARAGDLLYFYQPTQREPHHVMIVVGRSVFEPDGDDWIVYHTGPSQTPPSPGEVRKVRLADLMRHPSDRWRPLDTNSHFVGVFRLDML